jgi:hypothetical protein
MCLPTQFHLDEKSAIRGSGSRLQLKWHPDSVRELLLEIAEHGTDPSDVGGHLGDKKKGVGDGPEAVN